MASTEIQVVMWSESDLNFYHQLINCNLLTQICWRFEGTVSPSERKYKNINCAKRSQVSFSVFNRSSFFVEVLKDENSFTLSNRPQEKINNQKKTGLYKKQMSYFKFLTKERNVQSTYQLSTG